MNAKCFFCMEMAYYPIIIGYPLVRLRTFLYHLVCLTMKLYCDYASTYICFIHNISMNFNTVLWKIGHGARNYGLNFGGNPWFFQLKETLYSKTIIQNIWKNQKLHSYYTSIIYLWTDCQFLVTMASMCHLSAFWLFE